MYVYMCICLYVYMYIRICIYVWMYKHTRVLESLAALRAVSIPGTQCLNAYAVCSA